MNGPPVPEWIKKEADDYTPEAFDELVSAHVQIPFEGEMKRGTVINRKRNLNGDPIGTRNSNPLLDSRLYEVEFSDGIIGEYTTNMIAENIYAMVDQEGQEHMLMQEIVDHRKSDQALEQKDMYVKSRSGKHQNIKRTTKGWDLCVQWKDGTMSWLPLREMK